MVTDKRKRAYYSVYSVQDEMPIAIHMTIKECAAALGIAASTFKTMASKQKNGRPESGNTKYEIVRDEDDEPD